MSAFNQDSRTLNAVRSSLSGMTCNVISTLMGFVYRTVFIHYLAANYLGVNGLFTNILGILSMANLGIDSAIVFRFYKPISEGDEEKVGEIMTFMRVIYLLIGAVILGLGMLLMPFLNSLIRDTSEVPADINLHFVYFLFLVQTAATYLYSYRLMILTADQKQYLLTALRTGIDVIRYIAQIAILVVTGNYTLVLIISVAVTFGLNYLSSIWVTRLYPGVFAVRTMLPKEERTQIYKDTTATLCHKIGGTILNSTDNLVISKFVGLISAGLYSNYYLLISGLQMVVNPVLSNFTASLGNANVELSADENYAIYRRLQFMNLWIASFSTVCLYCLINDFIGIWVGESMVLDMATVTALCIQFFIQTARRINESYTNASGLFVRDKIRPFIEALLNLVISIVLVIKIGIAGVFVGTFVSSMLTVWWREPYLLHKYSFHQPLWDYWTRYACFSAISVFCCGLITIVKGRGYHCAGIPGWIAEAVLCAGFFCILTSLLFMKNKEYHFFLSLVLNKLRRR